MAKRMPKKQSEAIGLLIFIFLVVGVIGTLISKFFETFGFVIPFVVLVLGVSLYCLAQKKKKEPRRTYLLNKYGDEKIVEELMGGNIWEGQTHEQVIDSIGKPVEIDQKVLKTKKKEIWKYGHQGGNRFRLRVTLDNDEVVGWDQKS